MTDFEKKRSLSAKSIVDLCGRLNTAVETFIDSSTKLGQELGQADTGAPLNRVRVFKEVQSALLLLLPAAKLPGARAAETQAKFSRGLNLAGIPVKERI